MQSAKTKSQIVNYYEQAEIDYKLVWHLRSQLAMHYGFWDKRTRTLRQALENENRVLAEMAHISRGDHVLDAGCGVGGSSLYLARTFGCHVTGISLVDRQVTTAQKPAARHHLSDRVTFQTADFTAMPFADCSYDVVWAIESICHADDKRSFLAEAYRVLKPGGRLIVADGFARKPRFARADQAIMDTWLEGWGVTALDTTDAFCASAGDIGFTNIQCTDQTTVVLPSALRLYRYSFLAAPYDWLSRAAGWRGDINKRNVLAARYQYKALRKHLWRYATVFTVKPDQNRASSERA